MTWFQMESEVNDMSPKNDFSDIFDDDFEVTYEEDPEINFHTSEDTEQRSRPDSNTETIVMNADDYRDNFNDSDDSQFEEVLPEYDDDYEDDDADYEDDYYEDDYNTPNKRSNRNAPYDDPYNDRDYDRRSSGRKRSGGGVKLAAPIKKGGKALSRLTSTLLQQLSIVLILATTAFVLYNFYRASTPYGDIQEAIQTQKISQTLAAYLCVAALFLFFESISLLWSMTRVRVRDGVSSWREDTGRGLWSFILVFAVSYAAFLFSPLLPDSPEVIYGVKGALDVYGSLPQCIVRTVQPESSLRPIRKYKSSKIKITQHSLYKKCTRQ